MFFFLSIVESLIAACALAGYLMYDKPVLAGLALMCSLASIHAALLDTRKMTGYHMVLAVASSAAIWLAGTLPACIVGAMPEDSPGDRK